MALADLRKKHPVIHYRSFSISSQTGNLCLRYDFLLEPDIEFHPEVVVPFTRVPQAEVVDRLAFHLGLVELISYWKAACPPKVVIKAGSLSSDQLAWWRDLFIHGLGEFFFKNQIDPGAEGFLDLSSRNAPAGGPLEITCDNADLLLTGGGKDSTVTLELLNELEKRKAAMVVNPTRAALDSARIAGYTGPLLLKRTIDPALLRLNEQGYLNGHTPFSAYLAFSGILAAALNGFKTVIASNERSSNEPNTHFHGLEINHQYSKSLRFENRFRDYCSTWLTPSIEYFSFLRPLYDLQISRLFSDFPQHHSSFRSCNAHQRKDSWCGTCSKCAFVYLTLLPYLPAAHMLDIFSADLFSNAQIREHVTALCGLHGIKPFECVGTSEEARTAVHLSLQKCEVKDERPPEFLRQLDSKLRARFGGDYFDESLLFAFSDEHHLPPAYERILQAALQSSPELF